MNVSNAPAEVESSAISSINANTSSFPVSADASAQGDDNRTHTHCAEVCLEEGRRCSTSSHSELEMEGNKHESDDAGIDQQVIEGSPSQHDQGLNEGPHIIHEAKYSGQPGVDSSRLDGDVEREWAKQVDVDEEGPGECCRVCHLTVDRSPAAGKVIKLGCACKDDLALAHQRCAETWFTIKGNRTCEICGSTAQNILGDRDADQWNDMEACHIGPSRAERCWQNQPLCNTLVVCVLLVLIASWLFRVTLF
ncbi:hypothetical protein L7F22_010065 [Adiantum nelumboides]|nr:hypothetical protein [Adiantum nelumboides]MCO5556516.1 hypothetical protein [Adiantum nelumboides]